MTDKDKFTFAEYSTETANLQNENYKSARATESQSTKDLVDSNAQLMWWIKAKSCYEEKVRNTESPEIDDMIYIINCLGDSLTTLFGQNYPGFPNDATPPLGTFFYITLPAKGLDLKNDSDKKYRVAYGVMETMNDYFNDAVKHPDQSKRKKIKQLNKEMVSRFMEATKRVWLWFGERNPKFTLTAIAVSQFQDSYAEL